MPIQIDYSLTVSCLHRSVAQWRNRATHTHKNRVCVKWICWHGGPRARTRWERVVWIGSIIIKNANGSTFFGGSVSNWKFVWIPQMNADIGGGGGGGCLQMIHVLQWFHPNTIIHQFPFGRATMNRTMRNQKKDPILASTFHESLTKHFYWI